NFTFSEVLADLDAFIAELTAVNPGIRILFTVSPIPLVATNTDDNVLVASSYSKSVLRAAAGEVAGKHANVAYFPSYEIISSPASFGQYLAADLREVTEQGVTHVMDCFLSSYFGLSLANEVAPPVVAQPVAARRPDPAALTGVCEELFNEYAKPKDQP
ncbi:MAG TPA: GSCFA domain-containing protein, partial [Burkholderiaceae bacterium]